MNLLDRIENICERVGLPILAALFMMAAVICSGQTMTIAHADQGCAGSCVDAPRLGDFTVPGSTVFGFEQDRGRTTFTFYWNGPQSAVVQIGHVVQGQWVPYVVDVDIERRTASAAGTRVPRRQQAGHRQHDDTGHEARRSHRGSCLVERQVLPFVEPAGVLPARRSKLG